MTFQQVEPEPGQGREQFICRLVSLLREKPVEAGFSHPAEALIGNAVAQAPHLIEDWLLDAYTSIVDINSSLCADLLTCIGAVAGPQIGSPGWRLIELGLEHGDLQVRDAAAGALEHWGSAKAVAMLRLYGAREEVPRLARYMHEVVVDLSARVGVHEIARP